MATRKKSKGQIIKVNFGHPDAKKGAGGKINPRVPAGGYVLKATAANKDTSSKGNPMVVWDFVIAKGPKKGKRYRERTMLMPKNLWYLRQLLEGMGVKVPAKMVNLNVSKYVGKLVGARLANDSYEGKPQSTIDEFMTPTEAEELEEEEVEEEEGEDEDEFDEDEDEDDEDEEDEDDEDEDDEDEDDEDLEEVDLEDEL